MRRFTTNALPTLSPIGQQRRQAAGGGDAQMVSTYFVEAHAPAYLSPSTGDGDGNTVWHGSSTSSIGHDISVESMEQATLW